MATKKNNTEMKYGTTDVAVVPLRSTASEAGEMLSQLLFGECFEILIVRQNWTKIKLSHDGYEGWIDTKTITAISKEEYTKQIDSQSLIVSEPFIKVFCETNGWFFLPAGCCLPHVDGNSFTLAEKKYTLEKPLDCTVLSATETAMQYLNSPYIWGGRTPWGIDCSGLTQTVYRILGMNIPRDANKQVGAGESINMLFEAQAGDLAFFDDKNGNITHVGMLLGNGKIIHASGKVRIDIIDHNGIYNSERKLYTHSLRVIKKIL